jgi:predicted dehydrogenase
MIGMGTMNYGHLKGFLGMNEVQLLAVCDVDTNRRENAKKTADDYYTKKAAADYKGCAATNDYKELIARKDIDAVCIATPDHWHMIIAMEAVKAGKDVYCEKPLTLTLHESKMIIEFVKKYQRVFQTGSQQRSDKEFRTACEYVRNGRIGKLQEVDVDVGGPSRPCDLPEEPMEQGLDWDRWLGPAPKRAYNSVLSPRGVHHHFPAWRNYREYSGGGMTDWGAHHFDIAQWGLDADTSGPVEIIPPENPKAGKGVKYVYANGVVVTHGKGGGVTFKGDKGSIFVNRGKISSTPDTILKEPLADSDIKLYKSPGHKKDWIDCIRSRKQPICQAEVGARSVAVCHLGNLAYWNGRKLKWDPKEWKFVGDAEANTWLDRERREGFQLPAL